jgi:transposase
MSCAAGVDVSQRTLEVLAAPGERSQTFENTAAGLTRLIAYLASMKPTRVVFEASGGYEKRLMEAVLQAGWMACRINATRVRHFALALGQRAKTDPVDAAVLQRYGDLMEPDGCVAPDPDRAKLLALVKRRDQLVGMRTREINRSHQADKPAAASHRRVLRALDREIERIERAMAQTIEQSAALTEDTKLIATTPGIAMVIAPALQASLPELGHYTRRAISALVGVAPMADDSGKHHGQRHITGGRALPRTVLYQAVLSGLRCNPSIKALYTRLTAKGKPSKVAMTACMRHLLCMLNAMMRDHKPWSPPSYTAEGAPSVV